MIPKQRTFLMITLTVLADVSLFCLDSYAQNRKVTVSTVTSNVTLNDAVDYVITSSTPFSSVASVNIENDDAVVVFPYIKPSVVYNDWLKFIRVKGKAVSRATAWVAIYDNGAVVYPHSKEGFCPLTVYKDINYSGESRNDFIPFEFYNNVSQLGTFNNEIRSFKLKRGYMATLACNYDGTGYSRVFIAQDADVEVPELQRELKGRISFIRVFPWNRVSKKGCGAFDWNPGNVLNVSWGYDWGAGASPFADDVDYVGMHHHEDWPSYNEIANAREFNTVLGNNEPDNLNDPSQNPIPAGQMEATLFGEYGLTGSWRNIYRGGYRVGSPAMAGDYEFLRAFMELCRKYNYRIDFIATHRYLMGSGGDYDWFVNWVYDQYRLPIWITEWNYGAEWNGDLVQGPDFFRDQIAGIIPALDANPRLERQAFFNVLGDANRMMTNRHEGMRLMPAGEWYRDYNSVTSYTGGEGYVMVWNYWAPQDLTATLDSKTKEVMLRWINLNGKQTDSTFVERLLPDETEWNVIDRRYLDGNARQLLRGETLKGVSGLVKYRVRNFDSDGRVRMTGEAEVSVGGAEGNDVIQFGEIALPDATLPIKVDFTEQFTSTPVVITGPISDYTTNSNTVPIFTSGTITSSGFTFTPKTWNQQPKWVTQYTKSEYVPFIAMQQGTYNFGDMSVEVGSFTVKDTVDIMFNVPFKEGVTPVVVITPNRVTQTDLPLLSKVWNVTNTGFKCTVSYEDAANKVVSRNQQLAFIAVSPGKASIDSENDIYIAAGQGQRKIYTLAREFAFEIQNGTDSPDTLAVSNPVILAQLQTENATVSTGLKLTSFVERVKANVNGETAGTFALGARVRRVVDLSSGVNSSTVDNSRTGDDVGWIIVYRGEFSDETTAISDLIISKSKNPLSVTVLNGIVKVDNCDKFELFTIGGNKVNTENAQTPGVYIVRADGQTAKILVK